MSEGNAWLVIWAGVITFFTHLVGYFDPVLQLVFYLMFLDFLTGVLKAVVTKTYSSQTAILGAITKLIYLLLIGLGARVDAIGLYSEPIARTSMAWGVIIIESGSVVTNLDKLGVPVPAALVKILAIFKKKGDHSEQ